MEENVFKSMSGVDFTLEAEVTESKYASTGERGYIITPSGKMVVVPTTRSHGSVFSEYLTKYLGSSSKIDLNGANASAILAQYGHITYMSNVQNIKNTMVHGKVVEASSLYGGDGIVSLPNDLTSMTLEQVTALKDLIQSNKTISGRNRVDLRYGIISKGQDIPEERVMNLMDFIELDKKKTL